MNSELFAPLTDIDETTQRRLHAGLVAAASADGMLDVAYRTIDTPVGTLLLAATESGLIRVAYPIQDHDHVLETLAEKVSPRILKAPGRLDPVVRQLEEYFAGTRTHFDVPLDFRLTSGFRRQVLGHLPDIRYGTTASYATVAALSGSPKAVRAVGTACSTNPLPVVVPCHRVVLSSGAMGRYAGGAEAKQRLLELEAV